MSNTSTRYIDARGAVRRRVRGDAGLHLTMLRRLKVGDTFSYLGDAGPAYNAQSRMRLTVPGYQILVERRVVSFTGYGIDLILVTRLS